MFFTNPNEDIGAKLIKWWREVPMFTTTILYTVVAVFLLYCFTSFYFIVYGILIASWVINNLYLWEVLTFPYIHTNLLHLLFSLFSYLPTACRTERRLGTVRYISFFVHTNFAIGILFVGLMKFLSSITVLPLFSGLMSLPCTGLWPIIFVEMVLRCNKDPDVLVKFMCFPVNIKMKYYPWMLFAVFSLFFGVLWQALIGILVGYMRKR